MFSYSAFYAAAQPIVVIIKQEKKKYGMFFALAHDLAIGRLLSASRGRAQKPRHMRTV